MIYRRRFCLATAATLLGGCASLRPGGYGSRRVANLAGFDLRWVYDVVLSGDARSYAVLGPGAQVEVFAIEPWRRLPPLEVDADAINVAALDHDGGRLACAAWRPGEPTVVELWSTSTGERITKLPAPSREVVALEFADEGRLLMIVGRGGQVRVWDTHAHRRVLSVRAPRDIVMGAAISDDGDWVVTSGHDERGNQVNSWRRGDGWTRIATDLPGQVRDLSIAGDQLGVAMDVRWVPDAHACYLWSPAQGLRPLDPPDDARDGEHDGFCIDSVAFAADGRTVFAAGGTLCSSWSRVAWLASEDGPPRFLELAPHWIRAVGVRADGCWVAVGGGVTVWEPDLRVRVALHESGEPVDPDGISLCG